MSTYEERLRALFRGKQRNYPASPSTMGAWDEQHAKALISALQEQMGIILGYRGNVLDQHVAVRDLQVVAGLLQEDIEEASDVVVYGESIPGTGNVEDDLNVYDFTGHEYADGTSLKILPNGVVMFGHDGVTYFWVGPHGVTVGLGGSHTAVSSDFAPVGSTDHNVLSNREAANQHPQGAITDLVADQNTQNGRLSTLETRANETDTEQGVQDGRLDTLEVHPPRTDNPHSVTHAQLPDKGTKTHATIDAHINDTTTNPHQVDWDGLIGKPTEFPPEDHTHSIDDIADCSPPCIHTGLTDPVDAGAPVKLGDFWVPCDNA